MFAQQRVCYALALSVLCSVASPVTGWADAMRAPRAARPEVPAVSERPTSSYPTLVFDMYLRFFQRVISPVDGARSNMYPTGSDYARQAFRKHGALLGVFLTAERLMHEGNERQVAPRIRKYGLWRVYDPVEANDWWWDRPDWVYTPTPYSIEP